MWPGAAGDHSPGTPGSICARSSGWRLKPPLAGTTKEALDINLYKIAYKAFPYGELDGLLGAQATFEAVYSVSDGKLVQVDLTNKVASY